MVLLKDGTEAVSGAAEASLYLWFFPGSMVRGVRVGSAVKCSTSVRVAASSGTDVGGNKGAGAGDSSG